MNRKISVNLALAIAIIAMTVTFSVTMILSQNIFDKTVSNVREKEIQYNKIAEIGKALSKDYYGYDSINQDTLYDMLGAGYMQGIGDADARYYTAAQYLEYLSEENGTSMGVGFDVSKAAGEYPKIIRVYTGSPADEAGIVKGYALRRVGDTDTKNLTLAQVNTLLKGEQGTSVTLTLADQGDNVKDPVELLRRQYDAPTVFATQREGNTIGYFSIISFNSHTAQELKTAIQTMKESKQGLTGIVLDVRNNTGGSLDGALDTIDTLCPEGPIGSMLTGDGTQTLLGTSDAGAVGGNLPVVVLVNENTAAGAELLASAVRDFHLGSIVGVTTAGKGRVQCDPVRLSDGSAISYTVGLLLTSNGENFDGAGIKPDVESVMKSEDARNFYALTVDTDSQIAKAYEVAQYLMQQMPVYDESTAPDASQPASAVPSESTPAETAPAETAAGETTTAADTAATAATTAKPAA